MGCCFEKDESSTRLVHFGRDSNYPQLSNKVETTKYTWYTFLPKAILIQFIRPANFVYLLSAILQSIRIISSLNPFTAIAPFVFVISMSLVREGYEHYVEYGIIQRRYKKDKEINERTTWRLLGGEFVKIKWEQIHVGDIVQVKNNETVPADFVLLHSSEENQMCYVETANLDGESNLKDKYAFVDGIALYPQQLEQLRGTIMVDQPNSNLHQFSGIVTLEGRSEKTIDFQNILLRETVLKNTAMAVGVVVYSGYETKIAQNQGHFETKVSHVERKVNWIQAVLLLFLILLSSACAIVYWIYHNQVNNRHDLTYLHPMVGNPRIEALLIFFSDFLLLSYLIPVSLNVSIEVIKGFLGIFLSFDDKMYHELSGKRCSVNNVSILEELGQVTHVLTDKTGTLTANQMIFKHLSIGKNSYDADYMIHNVGSLKNDPEFHQFWLGLVICHDVVCDPDTKEYQGSSPDEVCFINYAKTIGYEFVKRTRNSIELLIHNQKVVYELCLIIPFSARKRMSVVVRNLDTQKVYIYTKGADSCVLAKALPDHYEQDLTDSINNFAKKGYRTLMFAYREISKQHYEELNSENISLKTSKAKKKASEKDIEMAEVSIMEKYESHLKLLGATAIEDRLQDKVPETIARLQAADIIVMMITGDKLETAENIGYLANFIKEEAKIFRFEAENTEKVIRQKMDSILQFTMSGQQVPVSIVIEGTSIEAIINSEHNSEYGDILNKASSVIFCRSSPKEKGSIVGFVKQKLMGVVLAVGDGGNDVGMIQQAHVGVGIMGKEGNSASAASDFAVGEFRFLDRLVLHQGRWFYYRLSYFFVYYGWKNLMMTVIMFCFMTESVFSAFPGLSQPFIAVYNLIIGLLLVLYYSIFEQDINDDLYKPAYDQLPIYYRETKQQKLFSYRRYILWTLSGVIIAVYLYCVTRFSLSGTDIVDEDGTVGDFASQSMAMSIELAIIVIMVLISDIKTYNWFSTYLVIGVATIMATVAFFIFENFWPNTRNNHTLNQSGLRFWATIFAVVGSVYAGKLFFDTLHLLSNESSLEKTLRAKYYEEKANYNGLHSVSQI